MIQQNLALRQALMGSAPRMRKYLGNFSGGTPGSTSRIRLFNVGIITRLILRVVATVDIGTATATVSPKAPFNLINRLKVTDYDGTDRVNASGYQLWVWNSARQQTPYGYNNGSQTAVLTDPVVPTATGTSQNFEFLIEVPLAYNADNQMPDTPIDLRGALLAQTAVGEAWINIDWNSTLVSNGNADAVYNGAATTTVVQSSGTTFNVDVFQEYLLPQAIGGQVPLPMLDLMTVYEFAGALRSTDNINANAEKLINYPNVRSVLAWYGNFMNNGVMNAAPSDITRFRLIANGNNVLREYLPRDKLHQQRADYMIAHADLRAGTYFEQHRNRPIETALYGAIQMGVTPSVINGTTNTNWEIGFESFYTKGSTLPGLSQASG
jgi:hypothetical protein